MKKFLLPSILLVASFAAPAFAKDAPAEQHFTRDGETYFYTTAVKADRKIISGRSFPSGASFELTVRGNRVTGVSGGQDVAFTVKPAAGSAELAAR